MHKTDWLTRALDDTIFAKKILFQIWHSHFKPGATKVLINTSDYDLEIPTHLDINRA